MFKYQAKYVSNVDIFGYQEKKILNVVPSAKAGIGIRKNNAEWEPRPNARRAGAFRLKTE